MRCSSELLQAENSRPSPFPESEGSCLPFPPKSAMAMEPDSHCPALAPVSFSKASVVKLGPFESSRLSLPIQVSNSHLSHCFSAVT